MTRVGWPYVVLVLVWLFGGHCSGKAVGTTCAVLICVLFSFIRGCFG